MPNRYCFELGIDEPRLETVKDHREASPYSLLIATLLERGGPMTLADVAARFEAAGVAPARRALLSLQRCKPARAPVYRDGDLYALDTHDDGLQTWALQLGLRGPRWRPRLVRDEPSVEATLQDFERRRAEHDKELAKLRRVLVRVFPAHGPRVVVLADVGERELETFFAEDLAAARDRILSFDVIGAVDVRAVLRALELDPAARQVAELSPPQKSKRLDKRGRTLKITNEMLIRGSCGISRPFGDPAKLRQYLEAGDTTRLRRRLEADVKSLCALYEYGRLHGAVRLRWGFLDEMIPVPWSHLDERGLHALMHEAHEEGRELEVVTGSAAGWSEPWARARRCRVRSAHRGFHLLLVDDQGLELETHEVQRARLAGTVPSKDLPREEDPGSGAVGDHPGLAPEGDE